VIQQGYNYGFNIPVLFHSKAPNEGNGSSPVMFINLYPPL